MQRAVVSARIPDAGSVRASAPAASAPKSPLRPRGEQRTEIDAFMPAHVAIVSTEKSVAPNRLNPVI
jgi:hypothetical protein